jgi:tRNA nucleotidyltransferase/poly(A) polymerase
MGNPHGGVPDVRGKIVRNVSEKHGGDPLRVLRGMPLTASFAMVASDSVIEIATTLTPNGLSQERTFCECRKFMLIGIKLSIGRHFLKDYKWTRFFSGN